MNGYDLRLRLVLVGVFILAGCSGCELNSARPAQSTRSGWFGNPTVIVFGVRSVSAQHDISFARVTRAGNLVGGGCLLYDHVDAAIKIGREKTQYFSYTVAPGIYSLERKYVEACDDDVNAQPRPTCAAFPKAFSAGRGHVWYLGTFEFTKVPSTYPNDKTTFDVVRPVGEDFRLAAQWAKGRFHEPLQQAIASPNTPMAPRFLCTP